VGITWDSQAKKKMLEEKEHIAGGKTGTSEGEEHDVKK